MRFDASDIGVYAVLVLDAAVSVVALLVVRATCEFCFRRLDKPIIEMPPDTQPPDSAPPPAGSTSVPPVE
jgi:hypothetical protein